MFGALSHLLLVRDLINLCFNLVLFAKANIFKLLLQIELFTNLFLEKLTNR